VSSVLQSVSRAPVIFGLLATFVIILLLEGSSTDNNSLIYFGANSFENTVNKGEYWRLITAPFLHSSILQVIWLVMVVWLSRGIETKLGHGIVITAFMLSALFGAITSVFVGDHRYFYIGAIDGFFGLWFFHITFSARNSKEFFSSLQNWLKANVFILGYNVIYATAGIPGNLGACIAGCSVGYVFRYIPKTFHNLISTIFALITFAGIYMVLRKLIG
jgi:membrane associated rhomboid family serine protease